MSEMVSDADIDEGITRLRAAFDTAIAEAT